MIYFIHNDRKIAVCAGPKMEEYLLKTTDDVKTALKEMAIIVLNNKNLKFRSFEAMSGGKLPDKYIVTWDKLPFSTACISLPGNKPLLYFVHNEDLTGDENV